MKHYPLWFKALFLLLPTMLGVEILGCVSSLPKMAHGGADFRQM
jgi:hypothetical protein